MPKVTTKTDFFSVIAESDQTVNNSTTLVDSTELIVKLRANTRYLIAGFLRIDTSTVADFDFTLKAITGASLEKFTSDNGILDNNFGDELFVPGDDPTGSETGVIFRAVVFLGTTEGDLQIQFAQNTPEVSNTILKEGSFITALGVN